MGQHIQMPLLPSRNFSTHSAADSLIDVKKGNKQAINDFIWQNQERVYAIAFIATGDKEAATHLTIQVFQKAFDSLRQTNPKNIRESTWEWLSQFAVEACGQYHTEYSPPPPTSVSVDVNDDGSSQVDWLKTVILGTQRLRKCLAMLSVPQRKVFVLHHQLKLSYEQIADVINEHPDAIAWLSHSSRIHLVRLLARG